LNYNQQKFSIIFSETVSADTKIKEIISTKKYVKDIYVVSSDRELINFVKNKGAKVIKCSDFNKLVRKTFKENRKESRKKEIKLTPLEIKHWLEVFKKKK
jgi:predicted RNA-binding protein with PIN domain